MLRTLAVTAALAALFTSAPIFAAELAALAPPSATPTQPQLDSSFTAWETSAPPRAMILSIHGFGLYKGAFDAFAKRMVQERIAVYAVDVRGFGSWAQAGVKYQKVDFYSTLIDIGSMLSWLKRIHPGVPVFLLGESMGGAIALQSTAMFPDSVDGLIASVPGNEYFRANQANMDVVLHLVRPNTPFDISQEVVDRATSKGSLKSSWREDPKARLSLTPKELFEFHQFMKRSHQLARHIDRTPVLILQGGQDRLAKPDGTIKLFNEITSKQKDLVMVGSSEHLIFEGAQFDDHIIALVKSWIDQHCHGS
jgi:alpha-beta hydrolase superfamily lysophospholipase